MEQDREQRLAEALADFLDRGSAADTQSIPDLALELDALAEIDRVLDPDAALPQRLSGHRIVAEIGSGGMGRVLLARMMRSAARWRSRHWPRGTPRTKLYAHGSWPRRGPWPG